MVRPLSRPVLAAIAAALAVLVTTTAIKARIGATADGGRRPEGMVTTPVDPIDGQARPPLGDEQAPPGLVRRAAFQKLAVKVDGRHVEVFGRVQVFDAIPGSNYIWLLRIYTNDKARRLLKEHHYQEQAVTLPDGEAVMSPSFYDTTELPPGSYKFELAMYAVPPDFPLGELKFGQDMKKTALIHISSLKKITIID